jgi:hypothetical protein
MREWERMISHVIIFTYIKGPSGIVVAIMMVCHRKKSSKEVQ